MANNTISTLSTEQTRELSNAMEILTGLSQTLVSDDLSISLTLKDSNNKDINLALPNLFSLDSEIKRIDKNQQVLMGLEDTAYVQQADGTFKKVIAVKQNSSPKVVDSLNVPVNFYQKSNWFFENFLFPLLYVKFPLPTINDSIGKIQVKRVIVNPQTQPQIDLFNTTLSGRNDIDYDKLIVLLANQNISYFIDEDTYPIPPSILKSEGSFGVISINDNIDSSTGESYKEYQFSNINYTDNTAQFRNSEILKVGDVLSINNETTLFKITAINTATRKVRLQRIQGKDTVKIGDNIFSIESKKYTAKEININIGYNEKQIIFVKPIDTEKNITTSKYSSGVCFDSNNLVLQTSNGNVTLKDFYQTNVTDFGMFIMNLAKEQNVPTLFGKVPSQPNLKVDNFQVVQINEHLQQDALTKDIRNKVAEKTKLKNEIENLDKEIKTLATSIQGLEQNSNERVQKESSINELINKKKNRITEYNSVLSSLNIIYKSNPVERIKPKYRVRGFWEVPEPQQDDRTGSQKVVQFNVQYRYLNSSGNPNAVKEYTYTDSNDNTQTGVFSNWVITKTQPLKRKYNTTTGKFEWVTENTNDVNTININQLDIPINPSEKLEIKIQSVSEAGFPNNPLVSEYTDPITIDFPESLNAEIDLYTVLEESAREEERSIIYNELQNYELEKHFINSKTVNNKYFAHDAYELDSGIKDSNGNVLSVNEVLKNLQNQITTLQNTGLNITNPSNGNVVIPDILIKEGQAKIYIEGKDRDGNIVQYPVSNGQTVDILPPSYFNQVSNLNKSARRGAIIKEEYKLVIENIGTGDLLLNSKYAGSSNENLPYIEGSNLVWRGTSFFDDDYKRNKRYDIVPVKYSNFTNYNSVKDLNAMFGYGEQMASQVAGQFVYSRAVNYGGTQYFYVDKQGDLLRPDSLLSESSITNRKSFIWNGEYLNPSGNTLTPGGNGKLSNFSVHIDHTMVKEYKKRLSELVSDTNLTIENILEHSQYFNLEKGNPNASKQMKLYKNEKGKYAKFGFTDTDRYLIGSNTTGVYFYMNPESPDKIRVNGNDSTSVKRVKSGEKITVPLKLEYRLADYYDESDSFLVSQQLDLSNFDASSISPDLKLNSSSVPSIYLNSQDSITNKQFIGVVGGYSTRNLNRKNVDISYEKIIGFDIFIKNGETISFDVRVNVVYGSTKNYVSLGTDTNLFVDVPDNTRLGVSINNTIDASLFGNIDNLIR